MSWQSFTPDPSTLSVVQQADPGSSFYFPTSITAPIINISVAGDLLRLPSAAAPAGPAGRERARREAAIIDAGRSRWRCLCVAGTGDPGAASR